MHSGEAGKFEMLYDARQRPQSVFLKGRLYIVYNGDAKPTSNSKGRTWTGPENDVTDLDMKGRLDWSSYQTKLPSKDGKFLHVVYTDYDDNKHSPDPKRFHNPRYNQEVSNEWKYKEAPKAKAFLLRE